MRLFNTREEVHRFFRHFFQKLGAHSEAGPALRKSGLVLMFRLTEPEASIMVDTRSTLPGTETPLHYFENAGLVPDITLEMSASALDDLWSGRQDIFSAMLAGKVKIAGKMALASRLVPLLKLLPPLYTEALAELELTPRK